MSGYETKVERIPLDKLADLVVRSLKDNQQFDDDDGEAARVGISSATWPLFGMVWASGRVLAEHLGGVAVAGRRVLELGCGLGLASMVLHRLGADVTASDIHPLAGEFLSHNLALNGLTPVRFSRSGWLDRDASLGTYDLIVGSDLLYERTHAEELSDFIGRHAAPTAEVIIVDPNRGHRAAFRRHMRALAFTGTVLDVHHARFEGVAYRGQILGFRRAA